jgi:hypothetical protein
MWGRACTAEARSSTQTGYRTNEEFSKLGGGGLPKPIGSSDERYAAAAVARWRTLLSSR